MKVLRNLTLHEQSDRECDIAARAGFALDRQPGGIRIEDSADSFELAVDRLAGDLRTAAVEGHAVLIGGHTGMWVSAVLRAGPLLPEMWCFSTRRITDDQGRWVFRPEGLLRVGWKGAMDESTVLRA